MEPRCMNIECVPSSHRCRLRYVHHRQWTWLHDAEIWFQAESRRFSAPGAAQIALE